MVWALLVKITVAVNIQCIPLLLEGVWRITQKLLKDPRLCLMVYAALTKITFAMNIKVNRR